MKILAFDTSNQPLTVSLAEDNQVIRVFSTNEARNHSIQLLPAIQQTIAEQGWTLSTIDRIIVAQGPGSFTGLRIVVTVAKVLADTIKCELIGVSSLAILAEQQTFDGLTIPLFNARNDNVFTGVYAMGNNVLPDAHRPVKSLFDWLASRPEPLLFIGDTDVFGTAIVEHFDSRAQILSPDESLPDGQGIVSLGNRTLPAKRVADFNPNYLRRTQAELNWLAAHPNEDKPENYVFEV